MSLAVDHDATPLDAALAEAQEAVDHVLTVDPRSSAGGQETSARLDATL